MSKGVIKINGGRFRVSTKGIEFILIRQKEKQFDHERSLSWIPAIYKVFSQSIQLFYSFRFQSTRDSVVGDTLTLKKI